MVGNQVLDAGAGAYVSSPQAPAAPSCRFKFDSGQLCCWLSTLKKTHRLSDVEVGETEQPPLDRLAGSQLRPDRSIPNPHPLTSRGTFTVLLASGPWRRTLEKR